MNEYIGNNEFLNYIISGNRKMSSQHIASLLYEKKGVEDIYEQVIKRALYTVGEMWKKGQLSVATEHLASAIVECILNEIYFSIISKNRINKTVVATCVQNEFHQIGVKMVADVFEMHGWNAHLLGADTPTKDLVDFISKNKPDVMAVSMSISTHIQELENLLNVVNKRFPDLQILIGGQAFIHGSGDITDRYDNITYIPDLYSLEKFIKNYSSQ